MTALADNVLEGLFYCGGHDEYLARENFYKASLRAGETRCKECSNKERYRRRKEDPLKWLQWKVYSSERRLGSKSPYPNLQTIKSIVERCGNKSVLGDGEGNLCIVRVDLDVSFAENPQNAVLVTSKQASRLPRLREKRIKTFASILCNAYGGATETFEGLRGTAAQILEDLRDTAAKNQGISFFVK